MSKCQSCGTELDMQTGKCPKCTGESPEMEGWVSLTRVANQIEYEMVAGLLQMAEIPVVRRVKGVDGFAEIILGMPIGGIEMFVPPDRFDEAFELINAPIDDEAFLEDGEEEK